MKLRVFRSEVGHSRAQLGLFLLEVSDHGLHLTYFAQLCLNNIVSVLHYLESIIHKVITLVIMNTDSMVTMTTHPSRNFEWCKTRSPDIFDFSFLILYTLPERFDLCEQHDKERKVLLNALVQ